MSLYLAINSTFESLIAPVMYKVSVNNRFNFDLEKDRNTWQINGENLLLDMIETGKSSFHFIKNNRSYSAEVVNHNVEEKSFQIKVNQTLYSVQVKDKFDVLLNQLGLDKAMSSKVSSIKAPMPGLVLNVLVNEGSEVKKGDTLLVLEAMKMENVLKSPTDGIIKKITVKKGMAVEKNQVLIEF